MNRDSKQHQAYLKGHHWRKKKADYFTRHPRKCVICNPKKEKKKGQRGLHLHHQTYVNIGAEKDEDLIALCGFHHHQLHHLQKTEKLSVEDATMIYMACEVNDYNQLGYSLHDRPDLIKVANKYLSKRVVAELEAAEDMF